VTPAGPGPRLVTEAPPAPILPADPTTRLFVAIDPPPRARDELATICRGLDNARWTRPEQLHLTLRFLGSLPTSLVGKIAAALGAVAASPSFRVAAAGFGVFPSFRSPRVLWAGIDPPEPLRDLARAVEGAIARTGAVEPEEKPFSPHVTLARLNGTRAAAVRSWMESRDGFASGPWDVSEFFLYSSRLTPAGAIHTRIQAWALEEAGAPVPGGR
jgi:RNA 2',3'-cyclic 3'-phosphodiesterase